ncbi:DMT family transporter [Longispora sp. K20-0274]|uniref:DMT family transporter n=1 Tax=Longispora sp. K20-0274 TaxID=3088255 RepID=UPI003999C638
MQRPLGTALAALCGAAMAVQARVNGELGHQLHDGVAAATFSFGSGLLLLVLLVPTFPGGRRALGRIRAALRARELRFWHLLGGTCGALLVAAQGLTVATLGVALFSVSVVGGQLASGLFVDRAGLGPGAAQAITPRRLVGAGVALVAVAVAVADRITSLSGIGLAGVAVAAGVAIAWQQAVNGRVRQAADAALPAALVNFLAGTVALVLVAAVVTASRGLPKELPGTWWLYVGGPLGILFIAIAATVVRATGVLVFALGSVAGQLVGAVLLDLVAPAPGHRLAVNTVVGVGVALAAVAIGATGRSGAAEPTRAGSGTRS